MKGWEKYLECTMQQSLEAGVGVQAVTPDSLYPVCGKAGEEGMGDNAGKVGGGVHGTRLCLEG